MLSTLYITRNGLLEPLGQSQVLSYLRGLSKQFNITLITYEKKADWAEIDRVSELRVECERLGIRWLPQHFISSPKVIAPAFSMIRMLWLILREKRTQKFKLIHARSYIPAAVALIAGFLSRTPFIFDMRALWPEELITAKRLKRGSVLHRLIVYAESACLHRAAAVVSLTYAGADHLKQSYPSYFSNQNLVVIPTCADLDRFVPINQIPKKIVIGCLGTVISGWFLLDWLATFFSVIAKRDSQIHFEITTRDDPDKVRTAIGVGPELQSRIYIGPCSIEKVQEVLQVQTASVMFFTQGQGKLGSSPTRMAEILGCGLPIVANDGVGDVARIIKEYKVGVLVKGPSEPEMLDAWNDLLELLKDPGLALRCRRAAENFFSLYSGTEAYKALYEKVLLENTLKHNKVVV
jgi:glycosyltransferase involved in cell wall biosynthesis